jgi:hypothetical protein
MDQEGRTANEKTKLEQVVNAHSSGLFVNLIL